MDMNIMPCPYKFSLHATVGYHGLCLTGGNYTAFEQ